MVEVFALSTSRAAWTGLGGTLLCTGGQLLRVFPIPGSHTLFYTSSTNHAGWNLIEEPPSTCSCITVNTKTNKVPRPKRRHIVLTGFINACASEGTLLDEDAFMP